MSRISGKQVTILDIAQAVGLSKTTVSDALSGSGRLPNTTRELVRREAEKLGYAANPHAQGLRRRGTTEIALLSGAMDLGVGTRKIHRIQAMLTERGYNAPIHAYSTAGAGLLANQKVLARALRRQRPQAIVCNAASVDEDTIMELRSFEQEGGILLCYDRSVEIACDQVVFDREDNTYQAARHLLDLGHRDIGYMPMGGEYLGESRWGGFCRALSEFSLQPNPDWHIVREEEGYAEPCGQQAARHFLELKQRPTGMCIVNDWSAAAFIAELMRAGVQVPRDVSVVSHDDTPVAATNIVPLTTISQPVEQIARTVVEMLDSRLSGRFSGPPRSVVLRGELITRQSASPA
jgi:LacI family transcriptional regulator